MNQRFHFFRGLLVVAMAIALTAAPAFAASSPSTVGPLLGGYWSDFLDHWGGVFQKQNGIILAALGLGAVSLLIITRGKWKK